MKKGLRQCVSCKILNDRRLMVKIIKGVAGDIFVNPKDYQPGRSAYVCQSVNCLEKAQKYRKLERSLKQIELEETTWHRIYALSHDGLEYVDKRFMRC